MRNWWLLAFCLLASSPLAARAQECMTDDDCAEGFECDLGPSSGGSSIDCPPGEECVPEPEPEPEPPVGACEPGEVVCESDDDCPLGLSCVEQSGGDVACTQPRGGAADGGISCEPVDPEPVESTCSYDPPSCESDDDCEQDGFVCIEAEGARECSGSGSACAAGEECPPIEVECSEPEIIRYCFPGRVDCSADADCAEGWRCVVLPEDARDNPPPEWEGASQVCLPEGLARAIEGTIELGDSDFKGGGSGSSDEAGGARGDALGEDSPPQGSAASGGSGDDGCATVGSARGQSSTALLLLAVSWLFARRRGAT